MDSEQRALEWAQANKKLLVSAYLRDVDLVAHENPAVIFMAGLPGAGKTEFAQRLLPQLTNKPLHIDMDEIATHIQLYHPKRAKYFRAGATVILERLYERALKAKYDILLDGTFSHPKALQNVERALKRGYSTRLYFISPDPLVAWRKTQDREVLEQRAISPESFADSYLDMLSNLDLAHKEFSDALPTSVVIKDGDNRLKDIIENVNDISEYTKPVLTYEELLSRIKLYE